MRCQSGVNNLKPFRIKIGSPWLRAKILCYLIILAALFAIPSNSGAAECVVLLHGLARSNKSLQKLDYYLQQQGFQVANIDYPSRKEQIESLAPKAITRGLARCRETKAERIHFVTHSMGGILVRYYLNQNQEADLGRVVMLSPPNQGSEIVDKLGSLAAFKWFNGPAGQQLGTGGESLPQKLAPLNFELGIIAGDRSINPLLSLLIPGADDGKVGVASTQLEGMKDFLIVHHSHTFIMRNPEVLNQVAAFLRNGSFNEQEQKKSNWH
jgi:hypothetical protein